jgi:ABC-type Na+ efflux pump permease subunit
MRAQTRDILIDGLWAGVIGYGVVVVVVALLNVLSGRSPFYTAALFGSALFYHLRDPAALVVAPGPVLAYNMVHMVVFLGLGLLCAWLVSLAERFPTTQYLFLVLLLFVAFHVYFAMAFLARPLLGELVWWHVGIASLAAAVGMGWYLLANHPVLRRELREVPMGETPPES